MYKHTYSSKLFFILVLFFSFSYSQTGIISGIVNDKDFQEPLPFANVMIEGTTEGITTDFDGIYRLEIAPGTYTLVFSFVGYETVKVADVEVKSGEVSEVNLSLGTLAQQIDEVIVTVEALRNTEQSVLTVQKKSANLLDGISAQNFKKIGASNLASAIKNVPGVSVQGGKYIYVRGLGDRYTKSILNGVDIPGLDPDRNTIQMDIFPTGVIDNVIVLKSASAELPADFTGGIVDIVTKNIPSQKTLSISVSGEYNPDMHFNGNYLRQSPSKSDFLGYVSGRRSMPLARTLPIPRANQNNAFLNTITSVFRPDLAAENATSFADFSASINYGNQFDLGEKSLGVIASVSYSKDYRLYEDFQSNSYIKNTNDTADFDLITSRTQFGTLGQESVLLSALAGASLKGKKAKYRLNLLHLQNGTASGAKFRESNFIYASNTLVKDVLEYNQKSVTNLLLSGKHYNNDGSFTVEWKLSPTLNINKDKDIRVTPFRVDDGGFQIEPSESGDPLRIWRNLNEVSYVGKVDMEYKYELFTREAKVKGGFYYSNKNRDYYIESFLVKVKRPSQFDYSSGDANLLFSPNYLWTPQTNQGTYVTRGSGDADQFESTQINRAAYLSNEMLVTEKLRTIIGLRLENYTQVYTGINQNDVQLTDEEIINKIDLFPSVNLIYSLSDNTNIRSSFSNTVARPSFKEASIAQIYDPITNRFFIGNIELEPSYINNFDLRFERFGEAGELIAFSGFYKKLDNPIELVTFSASAPDNFQPRNVGEATVMGLEIELRKNLGAFFSSLSNWNFNFNGSIAESRQKLDRSPGGEYDSRSANARNGEQIKDYRDLQGQSPYLINTGVSYNHVEKGIQAGLFFNTQGPNLQVVGIGEVPDVYTNPFNSLNLTGSYKFGEGQRSSINVKVKNLLNDNELSEFQSFGSVNQIYSVRNIGRSISIGYSHNF